MISLTGKILRIYKGTHLKHNILRIQSQSQKSSNKWAGIKSEVQNNIYTGICIYNDNPPFTDHCLVVAKGFAKLTEAMSHATQDEWVTLESSNKT